jgi:hypothetical protein
MTEEASKWLAVADELHTLHSINQRWARPGGDTRPAIRAPREETPQLYSPTRKTG